MQGCEMSIRQQLIQEIKLCSKNEFKYIALFDKDVVSKKSDITINQGLLKTLNAYQFVIQHRNIDYVYGTKTQLNIPIKERFYSNSNYNHAVLHELTHLIGKYVGQSKDYSLAYLQYMEEKKSIPDFNDLMKSFQTGRTVLSSAEKSIITAYARDETAVELTSYKLLEKIGIKPDDRDTAYMRWNISANNKSLEKLGEGFVKHATSINEIVTRTDKLLTVATKEYERANNISLSQEISKRKEREM